MNFGHRVIEGLESDACVVLFTVSNNRIDLLDSYSLNELVHQKLRVEQFSFEMRNRSSI